MGSRHRASGAHVLVVKDIHEVNLNNIESQIKHIEALI
jgi:hypothetical protein